eukprot:5774275-Pyramimonas_sp.AAC.1
MAVGNADVMGREVWLKGPSNAPQVTFSHRALASPSGERQPYLAQRPRRARCDYLRAPGSLREVGDLDAKATRIA